MSANIYWAPSKNKRDLPCDTPSRFHIALADSFGDQPWDFDDDDVPILQAMSSVETNKNNPYKALIKAIATHSQIRVWMEY